MEYYCVIKECDCRQVLLDVISDKGRRVAALDFPLDIDNPFIGPALNQSVKQSAGAEDLLQILIDVLNDDPDWYKGMCRRYRAVRKKIDGVAYQGAPFPKPGVIGDSPDDSRFDPEALLQELEGLFPEGENRQKKSRIDPRQQKLFAEDFAAPELSMMAELVDKYRRRGPENHDDHQERQQQLRGLLYRYEPAAEELTESLIELFFGEDDPGVDATLRLLADALEILRTDLERKRPESVAQMKHWQLTLAKQIFAEGVDFELGAEVTRVLLDSRVEILPELHEANSRRMVSGLEQADLPEFSPEQALEELLASLEELEINSSFELVDALLQMLAIGAADIQVALCSHLFFAKAPIARNAAVLMLFHPAENVRAGVAEFLAQVDGDAFTPESLRRLILSRNWFPEPLRENIDRAIANARRARIDCAPLPQKGKKRVYASAIDGAGAQSLQIILPQGKGYLSCSIMLKKGFGVADSFLMPFPDKRELNRFLRMMSQETGGIEMTTDYADRCLCRGLADGTDAGKVPGHWLIAIAEQLGCDQWKAIRFDPQQELARLRDELQAKGGQLLTETVRRKAFRNSAEWPEQLTFAYSWFEDDVAVDRELEAILSKRGRIDPMAPIIALLDKILEPRREIWLERLVLTAGWLKKAKKPPVPWPQMFHLAEAVADKTLPLKEIPLMIAIAENSLGAFMGRKVEAEDLV
ncbi:MAG: hypothetical protein GXP51_03845 [Deltaproteobacteria bacterium]|nr:hypothetical protein [Deltaproteobacteria bacterium]